MDVSVEAATSQLPEAYAARDAVPRRRATKRMVESATAQIMQLRQRREGTYVMAYDSETPKEICFVGFSGD